MKLLILAFSLLRVLKAATLYAIISQQRSGSTFLCDTLNFHPDVRNFQELLDYRARNLVKELDSLNDRRPSLLGVDEHPPEYSDVLRILQKQFDYKGAVGFKWMLNQPDHGRTQLQYDYQTIVQDLNQRNVSVILLERQNPIRRALSVWSMMHTDAPVHTRASNVEFEPLEIPASFFADKIKYFHNTTKIFEYMRTNLNSVYYVTYRELKENISAQFLKIQTFLRVQLTPLTSYLEGQHSQKIHTGTMGELVKGWDDIKNELVKLGYAKEVEIAERG